MNCCSQFGVGATMFFVDPETTNVIYAVDGQDNDNFFSYVGVKEGVVANPTNLTPFDMWFTYRFSASEIKSFANFVADNGLDAFEFKDTEIKHKVKRWAAKTISGEIYDNKKLVYLIYENMNDKFLKIALSYLSDRNMVSMDSKVFFNGIQHGVVSDIIGSDQMNTIEDVNLVNDFVQNNNRDSVDKIHNKFGNLVRDIVFRHAKANRLDSSSTDDMLQEAYMKVYSKLKDFDPSKSKITTYICITAEGQVRRKIQAMRRRASMEVSVSNNRDADEELFGLESFASTDRGGFETAQQRETAALIMEAIPEKYRDMMYSYCCLGTTMEELGVRFGITKARVHQIISQLIKDLQSNSQFSEVVKAELIFSKSKV